MAIGSPGHDGTDLYCKLIEKIASPIATDGSPDISKASKVSKEICNSCCQWFEPSLEDWNPITATLLINGFDEEPITTEQNRLRQKAIECIPVSPNPPEVYLPSELPPDNYVSIEAIEKVLPLPIIGNEPNGSRLSKTALEWMVGVTTAPRIKSTLSYCLDSLLRSGWEKVHVFCDGICDESPSQRSRNDREVWIVREKSVGGWSNFVLSALELMHRNPDADAYLMLQDDAMLARYVVMKPYMERLSRIIGTRSIASLYCCELDSKSTPGWHRSHLPYLRGAQAILFGQQAMQEFVASTVNRPWEGNWHHHSARPLEQRGIDGNVGRWATGQSIPVWLPSPSLVWHLGETSTLWPGAKMLGIRRAGDFLERHFSL